MDVHPTKNGIYRYWSIPLSVWLSVWQHDLAMNEQQFSRHTKLMVFCTMDQHQGLAGPHFAMGSGLFSDDWKTTLRWAARVKLLPGMAVTPCPLINCCISVFDWHKTIMFGIYIYINPWVATTLMVYFYDDVNWSISAKKWTLLVFFRIII